MVRWLENNRYSAYEAWSHAYASRTTEDVVSTFSDVDFGLQGCDNSLA